MSNFFNGFRAAADSKEILTKSPKKNPKNHNYDYNHVIVINRGCFWCLKGGHLEGILRGNDAGENRMELENWIQKKP